MGDNGKNDKSINEILLRKTILQLAENIHNGAITIVKQDSIVIQINVNEKINLGTKNFA